MSADSLLSVSHIEEAATVIDPVFRNSPQFVAESLSSELGMVVVAKIDCLNPIRSFKGRGAEYFAHRRDTKDKRPWICASAGNFGQGLAYAARKRGISLMVFAAETANVLKVERMQELGAEVRLEGADFDESKDACRQFASERGLRFVEDGREPAIAEGAGTIALELTRGYPDLDAVLVPVGNGALVGGIGTWMREQAPQTRVIGVGAERAPAMERSFRTGSLVAGEEPVETIADGVASRVPVPEALRIMSEVVDDMLLVSEEEILDAMRLAHRQLGLVLEGAGAVPLAAASKERGRFEGMKVAVVMGGGNLTAEEARRYFG